MRMWLWASSTEIKNPVINILFTTFVAWCDKMKYVLLIKIQDLAAVCLTFDYLITDVVTIIDKCSLTTTILSDIYKAELHSSSDGINKLKHSTPEMETAKPDFFSVCSCVAQYDLSLSKPCHSVGTVPDSEHDCGASVSFHQTVYIRSQRQKDVFLPFHFNANTHSHKRDNHVSAESLSRWDGRTGADSNEKKANENVERQDNIWERSNTGARDGIKGHVTAPLSDCHLLLPFITSAGIFVQCWVQPSFPWICLGFFLMFCECFWFWSCQLDTSKPHVTNGS